MVKTISKKYEIRGKNLQKHEIVTPKIELSGKWLQNNGFEIGCKVEIQVKDSQIIIKTI